MSDHTHTDQEGDTLDITNYGPDGQICINVRQGGGGAAVYVTPADSLMIAAELLKAAGQESVIVPKSKKEIEDFGHGNLRCGLTDIGFTSSSEWARDRAAELLALAEHRDAAAAREAAEKAEAEAAEKKLQERRDAIKTELVKALLNCAGPTDMTQVAINRIIELEDAAK